MVGTMCLSGSALIKAGANVSTNFTAANGEPNIVPLINQAEGVINSIARYNFITTYATLNADVKKILEEVCSNLTAIYMVSYDMSGYTDRIEAEDMINILRDGALRGLSILRDKKAQDFINAA